MFKSWCFAWLQSQKSVSSKTAADPSSRFCEFETVFQYRSRAKHWLKNLKILEVRAIFQYVFGIFKYNALSKRRLLLRKGFELIVCYLGSHQNSKYHLNILWRRATHPMSGSLNRPPSKGFHQGNSWLQGILQIRTCLSGNSKS